MKPSDTPYTVKSRVWRDEQPGDDPVLRVSIRFDPRPDASVWTRVDLVSFQLRAGQAEWSPLQGAVEPLEGGGFELRANGEPTIPAGAEATLTFILNTDQGPMQIKIPAVEVELVE